LRVAEPVRLWRSAMRGKKSAPTLSTLPAEARIEIPAMRRFPCWPKLNAVVQLLPQASTDKLPANSGCPSSPKGAACSRRCFTTPEYIPLRSRRTRWPRFNAVYLAFHRCLALSGDLLRSSLVSFCSLSTIGARVQKGVLRLAGAVVMRAAWTVVT